MLKNNNNLKIIEYLKSINLCFQTTIDNKQEKNAFTQSFYFGIDPSGNKIHLGHIKLLILAKKLIAIGMKMIIILGTFTATIGDPTMKDKARQQINNSVIQQNTDKIKQSIEKILLNNGINALILENKNWLLKVTIKEYIEIAQTFNLKEILNSKIFQARMLSNNPMYLHELSYFILQAYDFFYLKKNYNCNLQIGGQDQWINMTSGIALIKTFLKQSVNVLTVPILTDEKNEKISKTVKNSYIYFIDLEKSFIFTYFNFFLLPENIIEHFQKMLETNNKNSTINSLFLSIYNKNELKVAQIIYNIYCNKNITGLEIYNLLKEYKKTIDCYNNENYNIKTIIKKFTNITSSKQINNLLTCESILLNNQKVKDIKTFYKLTINGINIIKVSKYLYTYLYL